MFIFVIGDNVSIKKNLNPLNSFHILASLCETSLPTSCVGRNTYKMLSYFTNLYLSYYVNTSQEAIYVLVFSGVRVTRFLVLCVCFVDGCLSFCTFSFGHCVVCSSSIYGFWLPLWYLQTLLVYSRLKCIITDRNSCTWSTSDISNLFILNGFQMCNQCDSYQLSC